MSRLKKSSLNLDEAIQINYTYGSHTINKNLYTFESSSSVKLKSEVLIKALDCIKETKNNIFFEDGKKIELDLELDKGDLINSLFPIYGKINDDDIEFFYGFLTHIEDYEINIEDFYCNILESISNSSCNVLDIDCVNTNDSIQIYISGEIV